MTPRIFAVTVAGWVLARLLCRSRYTYPFGMLTFALTFLAGPWAFTVVLIGWLVFGPKVRIPLDSFLG